MNIESINKSSLWHILDKHHAYQEIRWLAPNVYAARDRLVYLYAIQVLKLRKPEIIES